MNKVLIIVLLLIGVGVTFWDYRNWRREETKNFGQGFATFAPAYPLDRMWQNGLFGIRLNYSKQWAVVDNSDVASISAQRQLVARWEPYMRLSIQETQMSMPNISEIEVNNLRQQGIELIKEREPMRGEKTDLMVLTWENGDKVYQRVLAISQHQLVVMDFWTEKSNWNGLAKTFEATFKSLEFI